MNKRDTLAAIKRHAKAQGLSLPKLCEAAGINYVTVWRWGQSRTTPRQATVEKLLATRRNVEAR